MQSPGRKLAFVLASSNHGTMIVKDGLIHIPVGGGIVADSDPAAEYDETLVKAQAMFAALGLAIEDLVV